MIERAFLLMAPLLFPLFLTVSLVDLGWTRDVVVEKRIPSERAVAVSTTARLPEPEFLTALGAAPEHKAHGKHASHAGKRDCPGKQAAASRTVRKDGAPRFST